MGIGGRLFKRQKREREKGEWNRPLRDYKRSDTVFGQEETHSLRVKINVGGGEGNSWGEAKDWQLRTMTPEGGDG